MPKTRDSAVNNVKSVFLPAEKSAESAAAHGARCIAVMIEERARARLPLDLGADALDHVVKGTNLAIEARRHFLTAHALLATLPGEIGATVAYGPDDCPPNQAQLGTDHAPTLRVVG
ncbi:hypothetical protein [Sphingomonas sp. R86521]|uniref:hypothetical protein n=1 Tax=Sphingomonas sp. R86521 TaxID=3093860 RepID=UPI0036D3194F